MKKVLLVVFSMVLAATWFAGCASSSKKVAKKKMVDKNKGAILYDDLNKDHTDLLNTVENFLMEIGKQNSIIGDQQLPIEEFMVEESKIARQRAVELKG